MAPTDRIRPRTPPPPTPAPPQVRPQNTAVPATASVDGYTPAAPTAVPVAAPSPGPAYAASDATTAVDEARENLESAGEAAREKEEELQTLLARVGAGLTPEQITELQTSFREEHAEIYAAEEAAAAELADALRDPSLDHETRLEGYQELARSPSHAQQALEWAGMVAEANPTLGASEELQELAATALENALPSILANSPDAETALADLETYLGPLVRAGGGANGVREAYQALQATRAGDYDRLANLADKWDSKLSRAIGIAAVAVGAASAVGAVREGEYLRAIESLGTAGSRGLELLVGFTQSTARASTGASATSGVLGATTLRFAGAFAAVASAAGFAQDFKAFLDGKGAGYGVAAVGDLLALAGGVVLASGVGAPIGALLIAVGTVVSAVGRIFGAQSEREKIGDDIQAQLERAGIDENLAELYGDNFEEVAALGQAGFTPAEIQEIVQGDDFDLYKDNVDQLVMLADSGMSKAEIEQFVTENAEAFEEKRNIEAFLATAQAAGIEPGDYVAFAAELRGQDDVGDDWGRLLAQQYANVNGSGSGAPVPSATLEVRLRSVLESFFPDAHQFAVDHAPEVYGEDAEKAQEARLDVDQIFASGSLTNDIALAQLVEEHDDDPAYLDAMISYLREEYGDDVLDFARQAVEIYEDDSLEAFDDAVDRTS